MNCKIIIRSAGIAALVVSAVLAATPAAQAQRLLTLDEAIETAMEQSPSMIRQRISLERTQDQLRAQRAAQRARFSIRLNPFSIGRDSQYNDNLSAWIDTDTKNSNGTFSITQPIALTDGTLSFSNSLSWRKSYSDYTDMTIETFSSNASINYSQPIFTYNSTKMDLKELELDVESATLNFAMQRLNLEVQIARSYYSLYQSQQRLQIALEEQQSNEADYNIIKSRAEAGMVALSEQYQAELNYVQSQASYENTLVQFENSKDDFKTTLGLPMWDDFVLDVSITEVTPIQIDEELAVKTALERRTEIRENEISLINAKDALIRAKAQNEFAGTINFSLGVNGNNEDFSSVYDNPTRQQNIGLSLDIPIWDWGASAARVHQQELNIQSTQLTDSDDKRAIEIEVRQAIRELNNLVRQISIQEQSNRNAQLTFSINQERYRNGEITALIMNDYRSQLSTNQLSLLQAQIDYKLAIMNLRLITLWDFETNQPVELGVDLNFQQ